MSNKATPEAPVELIRARPVPRPGRWIGAAILVLLAVAVIHSLATNPIYDWPTVWSWLFSKTILRGLLFTLILTVGAMVLGTAIAVLMAVMRQSENPVLRAVSTFYIWFFRGTPVYTQLIFWSLIPVIYPSITIGIPFVTDFLTFQTAQIASMFWLAMLGLGFNEGAYLAEIIRAGINSVGKGQWEAATALGMSRGQVMSRIVLPQAMRVIVPPLGNETISMLKTTSLVSAMPVTWELTFVARDIGQELFQPVPLLLTAAIWYLIVTSVLMVGQHYLERHFGKGFDQARRGKKAGAAEAVEGAEHNEELFLDVTP